MTLDTGTPIAADNVVIQQVVVTESDIVDVLGYPSPEVTLTGSGKAWILRDGVLDRRDVDPPGDGRRHQVRDQDRRDIPLAPGNTLVELVPKGTPPTVTK